MAKVFQRYIFDTANPYVDDRGVNRLFSGRFAIPADMTTAQASAIAGLAGAAPIAATDKTKAICPDPGVRGRRLTFIRRDGNSLSLTMTPRNSLIADATLIRTAIDAVDPANNVVCVKLDGEFFPDLFDELSPAIAVPRVPGVSSRPATGGKQNFYSGTMSYDSDAVYGLPYPISFKVATESTLSPPAAPILWATELAAASTVAQNNPACPSRNPRKPRAYIVQALVTQGGATETQITRIPVATHLPADILTVGQLLAANPASQCIAYRGERNDRFHKLLP
jgi:hypothetical protein